MTRQIIGVGTIPNDGTGDPLRTAFTKSNANFLELYETGSRTTIPPSNPTAGFTAEFFVNSASGNNTNDGRSTGTAWLTIQHAVNEIATKFYLPPEQFTYTAVFLYLADGTYTTPGGLALPTLHGAGFPVFWIIGNQDFPANVILNVVDSQGFDGNNAGMSAVVYVSGGGEYNFTGVTLDASTDLQPACDLVRVQRGSAFVRIENCRLGKAGNAGGGNHTAVYADEGSPTIMMQGNWIVGTANTLMFAYGEHTCLASIMYLHNWLNIEVDPLWPSGCIQLARMAVGWFNYESITGTSSGLKVHLGQGCHLWVPGGLAAIPGTGIINEGGIINAPGEFAYDPTNGMQASGLQVDVNSRFGNGANGFIGILAPGDPGTTPGIGPINTGQGYPLLSNYYWSGDLYTLPWEAAGIANFQGIKHTGTGGIWYYGIDGDYYVNSDSTGPISIAHGTYSAMQNFGAGNVSDLVAVYGLGWHNGSGLVYNLVGVRGGTIIYEGTAASIRGIEGVVSLNGGVTTKAVGLLSSITKRPEGTVGTVIGLEIDDTSGLGTTNYNVLSKGAASRNVFEGTVESPSLRNVLQADLELYVTTTGNDTTGTGTAGSPWASVQRAFDYVMTSVDYGNKYSVTVHVAAGTYNGECRLYGPIPGGNYNGVTLSIDGAVTFNSSGDYTSIFVQDAGLNVGGTGTLTLIPNAGGSGNTIFECENGGDMSIYNEGGIVILPGTTALPFILWCASSARMALFTSISITGNIEALGWVPDFARLNLYTTVTFVGSVAANTAVLYASHGGDVRVSYLASSGTVTGKKYDLSFCATLDTGGSGTASLPGTIAGTTSTGGQAA